VTPWFGIAIATVTNSIKQRWRSSTDWRVNSLNPLPNLQHATRV